MNQATFRINKNSHSIPEHPLKVALNTFGLNSPINNKQINLLKEAFNIQNNRLLLNEIKRVNKTITVNSLRELNNKQYTKLFMNQTKKLLNTGGKRYVKLQSGGKRLVHEGKHGGRYYIKGGAKHYLK
jgi:hypothetical protein